MPRADDPEVLRALFVEEVSLLDPRGNERVSSLCLPTSFLLKPSCESIILKLILASLSLIEIYGSIISFFILSGIFE